MPGGSDPKLVSDASLDAHLELRWAGVMLMDEREAPTTARPPVRPSWNPATSIPRPYPRPLMHLDQRQQEHNHQRKHRDGSASGGA